MTSSAGNIDRARTVELGPVSDLPAPTGDTDDGAVHLLLAGTCVRLVLAGDISQSVHAELVRAVDEAVSARRPVQIDARHVRFMDSSGIAMIAQLAQRTDSRLLMIQPPDVVQFLLDVTKLNDAVEVTEHDPGLPST